MGRFAWQPHWLMHCDYAMLLSILLMAVICVNFITWPHQESVSSFCHRSTSKCYTISFLPVHTIEKLWIITKFIVLGTLSPLSLRWCEKLCRITETSWIDLLSLFLQISTGYGMTYFAAMQLPLSMQRGLINSVLDTAPNNEGYTKAFQEMSQMI